ncbi:MAG TPA: hypothetical protein VF101_15615, partial [Gaiellaceae bacterium]
MRLVRGLLGVGALALLLLLPARDVARPLPLQGHGATAKESVAFVWSADGARLAAIDDLSLRPVGRRSALIGYVDTWAFSRTQPALLAVAARPRSDRDDDVLRFVNVSSRRLVKRTVNLGGGTRALLWARPDRVVALVGRCCSPGTWVVTVDPGARRIVSESELDDDVSAVARAA